MPIYLPESTTSTIQSMTPRQIVAELDKYVVGQLRPPPTVAQRHGNGALGVGLADDETVEFGNDLAGRKGTHGLRFIHLATA